MVESLSGWVFGQRLDDLTDEELQAEILYAEANLLLSFLTFLQVPFPFHYLSLFHVTVPLTLGVFIELHVNVNQWRIGFSLIPVPD